MSCNVTCEMDGGKCAGKMLTEGATAPVWMRVVWASVLAEALPARVARLTNLQQDHRVKAPSSCSQMWLRSVRASVSAEALPARVAMLTSCSMLFLTARGGCSCTTHGSSVVLIVRQGI